MSEEIKELGEEGFNMASVYLKFGDIIENGWASYDNPARFGILVKARGHSLNITDGKGRFWDLVFDHSTKIKVHGNVLNDNYEKIKNSRNKPGGIQEP